jgi:hypothetical protein
MQVGSSGAQQSSSPLFDPAALSLALTNVVDKLHRKNKQARRMRCCDSKRIGLYDICS